MPSKPAPQLPPPENPQGYTAPEACTVLNLKPARVYTLFKEHRVAKHKNVYYASADQIIRIMKRSGRCLKGYDL